jgi:CopG family transcriptional regulator, nickel-responsive regulator
VERFTISISDTLAAEFDQWLLAKGYSNRSEGFRDILRKEIESVRLEQNQSGHSIATFSFVYNHHERTLSERMLSLQHNAHDIVVFSNHVHLDHDDCLECLFLRGPTQKLLAFTNAISAEPGVRHGAVNLIPVKFKHVKEHDHHEKEHLHTHLYS